MIENIFKLLENVNFEKLALCVPPVSAVGYLVYVGLKIRRKRLDYYKTLVMGKNVTVWCETGRKRVVVIAVDNYNKEFLGRDIANPGKLSSDVYETYSFKRLVI